MSVRVVPLEPTETGKMQTRKFTLRGRSLYVGPRMVATINRSRRGEWHIRAGKKMMRGRSLSALLARLGEEAQSHVSAGGDVTPLSPEGATA